MPYTNAWDETTPAGTENASTTDDYLRKHRLDLGERLEALLYGFDASSNAAPENTAGIKNLPCYKQGSDPTKVTDYGHLYVKLVSGIPELFFQDDTNTALQLTSGGKLKSTDELVVDGASTLTGNVAMAGTLDIGSSTAVGGVLDEDAMGSDSATNLATQQSIKAYVDDSIATDGVAGAAFGGSSESTEFSSGLIMKTGTAGGVGSQTITFGTAFPTALVSVVVTPQGSAAIAVETYVVSVSASSFGIRNADGNVADYYWVAMGY